VLPRSPPNKIAFKNVHKAYPLIHTSLPHNVMLCNVQNSDSGYMKLCFKKQQEAQETKIYFTACIYHDV